MKTSLFGLAILLVLSSLFGYYISYNYIKQPFIYEDVSILESDSDHQFKDKESFDKFFLEYVDCNKYLNDYECDLVYCNGDDSFISMLSLFDFCYEGYALFIDCEESYNSVYDECVSSLEFIEYYETQSEHFQYIESISIGNWTFKELYFNIDNYSKSLYLNSSRCLSVYFGYNEINNQISFVYLNNKPDFYIYEEGYLVDQIKNSFNLDEH